MPELPEVETIKRQLEKHIINKAIINVYIIKSKVIKGISPAEFKKELIGKKIVKLDRRAKYLVFTLSSGKILLVHLGMSGALILGDIGQKYVKYIITFNDGQKLYYCDSRMFGKTRIVDDLSIIGHLGPEPLETKYSAKEFYQLIHSRKTKIKNLIMDQKLLAGVGNIYACEALFDAKIDPRKPANKISYKKAALLLKAIREVLIKSIKKGGSSVDRYVNASGEKGQMQLHLKVYDREGEKCRRCSGKVKRIVVGQRGTYYCPGCQK